MSDHALEPRVTDLEIRLMHQEDTIDTLTDTLLRQQRVMDSLHEQLEALQGRIRQLEDPHGESDPGGHAPEPPPPHY